MGERGRKSREDLAVVPQVIEVIPRAKPPSDLTDEQADEWNAVVARMPADWFGRETHGLLTQYCRHVVASRRVADLIAAVEKEKELDLDQYDKLLKMQEREGRAMSSLATRMRLSQQTQWSEQKSRKVTSPVKMPWEK